MRRRFIVWNNRYIFGQKSLCRNVSLCKGSGVDYTDGQGYLGVSFGEHELKYRKQPRAAYSAPR
jgi:hypothetical protein